MAWLFSFVALALVMVGGTAIVVGMDPYRGSEGLVFVVAGVTGVCTGFIVATLIFVAYRLGEIRALLEDGALAVQGSTVPVAAPSLEPTAALADPDQPSLPLEPPKDIPAPVLAIPVASAPVFPAPAPPHRAVNAEPAKAEDDKSSPPDWLSKGVAAGVAVGAGASLLVPFSEDAAKPVVAPDLPPLDALKAPLETLDAEPPAAPVADEPPPVVRHDDVLETLLAEALAAPPAPVPSETPPDPLSDFDIKGFLDAIPMPTDLAPPDAEPAVETPAIDDKPDLGELPPLPELPPVVVAEAPRKPLFDYVAPPNAPVLLRDGVIAGLPFKLFSDGAITAVVEGEERRFDSLKSFRTFVEGQGS